MCPGAGQLSAALVAVGRRWVPPWFESVIGQGANVCPCWGAGVPSARNLGGWPDLPQPAQGLGGAAQETSDGWGGVGGPRESPGSRGLSGRCWVGDGGWGLLVAVESGPGGGHSAAQCRGGRTQGPQVTGAPQGHGSPALASSLGWSLCCACRGAVAPTSGCCVRPSPPWEGHGAPCPSVHLSGCPIPCIPRYTSPDQHTKLPLDVALCQWCCRASARPEPPARSASAGGDPPLSTSPVSPALLRQQREPGSVSPLC